MSSCSGRVKCGRYHRWTASGRNKREGRESEEGDEARENYDEECKCEA